MTTTKTEVEAAFQSLAEGIGALWSTASNYCSFSKNGITVQVLWLVDGISGLFVTLLSNTGVGGPKHGYGLAYLIEFKGGNELEIAKSKSNNLASLVDLTRRYAVPLLEGLEDDFDEFVAFAGDRVRANVEKLPPLPKIKTNKTVRAEWI